MVVVAMRALMAKMQESTALPDRVVLDGEQWILENGEYRRAREDEEVW